MSDEYARGYAIEGLLNQWFQFEGISIREPFRLVGDVTQRTVEQIDGVVSVEGHVYLVEIKWWKQNLGPGDVAQHAMRVINRRECRGLYIVNPGYTEAAVQEITRGLTSSVLLLATIEELYHVLTDELPLSDWVAGKANVAIVERKPLREYRGKGRPKSDLAEGLCRLCRRLAQCPCGSLSRLI